MKNKFLAFGALALTAMFFTSCKPKKMEQNTSYLLVGTYTQHNKDGIYVYQFDEDSGSLHKVSHTQNIVNPSYLALSPNDSLVYAVNENTDTTYQGMVSAFSFDNTKGQLHFLNEVPSNGDAPCFVAVDNKGENVVVANYNGGNFSVYKMDKTGKLLPAAQIIAHTGTGANKMIQTQSHVHSTFFSPDQKYLFVCDLGNDTLYQYPFDAAAAKPVSLTSVKKYKVPAGFGPRHLAFSPNHQFVYLLNELDAQIIAYQYANDSLKYLQTVVATDIPDTTTGDKGSAAIRISPDGKYLYASNRGNANDIAIFKIEIDGHLSPVAHQATDKHPRDFAISPSGKYLLVASRDNNSIKVYSVDKNTGLLTFTGKEAKLSMPVSVLFAPKK